MPNAVIAEQDIPQALEHEEKGSMYYVKPIVQGEIKDFEALEAVIRHVLYYQSGWSEGSEENIVIVEPALTPRLDRERITQMMFEKFNVNSLFVTDASVASLYSVGKTGGIVVDVGYEKIGE
jgi:actin-related protein